MFISFGWMNLSYVIQIVKHRIKITKLESRRGNGVIEASGLSHQSEGVGKALQDPF